MRKVTQVTMLALLTALPVSAAAPPVVRLDSFGDPLPAGAVARIGTIRLRQPEEVQCLAFSPDDKLLVSSGGGIRFWNPATGKQVGATRRTNGSVVDVAFS